MSTPILRYGPILPHGFAETAIGTRQAAATDAGLASMLIGQRPCAGHSVIKADGGISGCHRGVSRKRRLLRMEAPA